jgi:type IV pilus assembly protein PilC
LVVIAVVVVMMVSVVPKLLEIFEWGENLPASTKILMWISNFFVNYWWLLLIIVAVLWIWFVFWKSTKDWKYIFDNLKMKFPVFGELTQKTVLSKFARVFSWLTASWVSIVESLKISSNAVWNEVYKQRILLLSQDVASGIKIWESMDWDKLFPPMMVQMIQVWEQTAKLDQTVSKVADFYDEQVDNTIAALNKLLEPFIIVILAWLVGFLAVAIMQPIMGLADTVSNM